MCFVNQYILKNWYDIADRMNIQAINMLLSYFNSIDIGTNKHEIVCT